MWRGLQPAASRLVSTLVHPWAGKSMSRHECRDGSLGRPRHGVESAIRVAHDQQSDAAVPARRRVCPEAYLFFFVLFVGIVFATHLPLLGLPLYWDELGYFIPAALDLHRLGLWIPRSTVPNVHPPGLMAYLAGAWSLFGYSIPATRAAMLLVASAAVFVTFLLAIRLCRDVRGAPAFWAVLALLLCPLVYTQAMLAQLDLPAMLLTVWALACFLGGRFLAAALVSTALVLVKETGVVVPLVFAFWLWREGKPRQALYFALPLAALGAWLAALYLRTGSPLGNAEFTRYNLLFPLHPVRAGAALLRRLYYLLVANFHWAGWLAVWWAARRARIYSHVAWRVTGTLALSHVLVVSFLGGAALERYLLPVLPLVYVAMAAAWSVSSSVWMRLSQGVVLAGLLAGLFVNPPYPFPYENNLAVADFVQLHQTAARFLERHYAGRAITTAWPLSAALRRPDYGYVQRRLPVQAIPDFKLSTVRALDRQRTGVFVLYSRDWEAGFNLGRWDWLRALRQRFYGWEAPISPEELQASFGLTEVARWNQRGQWIAVFARAPKGPTPGGVVPQRL